MKIAIIGGLGYIGNALLDIYKETEHKITVIDNIFLPQQTKNREAEFIMIDIRDHNKINFKEFDIVYNFAAITSTKADDEELIEEINHKVAIEIAKKSKRYIFASSCNVFSGLTELKDKLTEEDVIYPDNYYAESKAKVENWLEENHDNYIVCRFGANYGYSDGLRYGPVGNVFLLNSILNKPITVLGTGKHIRPFIHVKDTARALYHLAHNNIKNEIFHTVRHNFPLGELAKMIKNQCNPNTVVKFIESKGETPGYHISNKKLLSTGFKFKYTFNDAYKELKEVCKNVQKA